MSQIWKKKGGQGQEMGGHGGLPLPMNCPDWVIFLKMRHTSQKLELPGNIRLIKLPPRNPELNPTKHIWEELREKNFANKAFKDLDEVEDKLCQGLNDLAKNPVRTSFDDIFSLP